MVWRPSRPSVLVSWVMTEAFRMNDAGWAGQIKNLAAYVA